MSSFFFFLMIRRPPRSTLFPYTSSSDLGGSPVVVEDKWGEPVDPQKLEDALKKNRDAKLVAFVHAETSTGCQSDAKATRDRKSTRLNSSHLVISYAVFCLKKKKKQRSSR